MLVGEPIGKFIGKPRPLPRPAAAVTCQSRCSDDVLRKQANRTQARKRKRGVETSMSNTLDLH